MSTRHLTGVLGALGTLGVVSAPVVIAADYLTLEQAQKAFFPNADDYRELALTLTPAQRQAIANVAGPQPPHGHLRIWAARNHGTLLGHVFVDEVIGRQDLITYAACIDTRGRLGTIEILSYRESHGGEIRNHAWRAQFADKDSIEQLRFRTDIKNIAGATLSSEHVTQGVRWLVALWQNALRTDATS
jgi:hypothetical protein